MIVTIVGATGAQIYRGHEVNEKVARLIDAGNTRVDALPPDRWATWDGEAWVHGSPPPPPAAVDTPITAEDTERLLLALPGVTAATIAAAKRDRGKPMPS